MVLHDSFIVLLLHKPWHFTKKFYFCTQGWRSTRGNPLQEVHPKMKNVVHFASCYLQQCFPTMSTPPLTIDWTLLFIVNPQSCLNNVLCVVDSSWSNAPLAPHNFQFDPTWNAIVIIWSIPKVEIFRHPRAQLHAFNTISIFILVNIRVISFACHFWAL